MPTGATETLQERARGTLNRVRSWPAKLMVSGTDQAGRLELATDRIVVGTRALARDDLRCELVSWIDWATWTKAGSAVLLRSAEGALAIGGRDHLARGEPPSSTVRVDASLSAPAFVEFASALGFDPSRYADANDADALVIDLVLSTTSLRGRLSRMRWWIATIAAAGAMGFVADIVGLLETDFGRVAVWLMILGVVLFGLFWTFRNDRRPRRPRYRLLVQPTSVMLCDARIGGAPIETLQPNALPRTYKSSGRGGTVEMPVVRLEWPSRTLVVGGCSYSFRWPLHTRRAWRVQYLVGAEEWSELVRALHLA